MKRILKAISTKYDIDYFTDENNIGNQNLVRETIEYFTTGEGARVFNAIDFLNLLEKQYQFLKENIQNTDKVMKHLNRLALNELEKHILFGLLLKWFGGYPVNNLNEDFDTTLKAIQKEFLSYEGNTPEKEFCKADNTERRQLMKLSISGTNAINSGMDWITLYNAMEDDEKKNENHFQSFDSLFEAVFKDKHFENATVKTIQRSRYNFRFNCWLQETKGLEYGNKEQYKTFLNAETFQEYLDFEGNKTLPEIYFEKVENEAAIYINLFNKRYEASGNKERLLQTEIENYEQLFFAEKLPLHGLRNNMDKPIKGLPQFCSIDVQGIRDLYQRIIVESQRDYYANFHNIRMEALVKYYEHLKSIDSKTTNNINSASENGEDKADTLLSSIKEKLKEFKNEFNNEQDFAKAIKILHSYFQNNEVKIDKPLFVRSGNVKKLAFALGEVWRTKRNNHITYEYLCLYKQAFSVFKEQKIDKKNVFSNNLYKYSISKT